MRARLKPLELSAIAPGRSSRPTSSMTNDWRAGISNALIRPLAVARASSHPIVMSSRPREPPERGGLEAKQRLGDLDETQLVGAVDDHARMQRQQQHRERLRRGDEADQERAVRELERHPALGHDLHPGADQRQRLTEPEQAKVPVPLEGLERIEGRALGHAGNVRRRWWRSAIGTPSVPRVFFSQGGVPCASIPTRKFSPELADAIDLQSLLDKLADFLLQSGFAGGDERVVLRLGRLGETATARSTRSSRRSSTRSWRAVSSRRRCSTALRGGDDEEGQAKLAKLLDDLVQRLIDEGYLNLENAPQMPAGHQPVTGPGGLAKAAARDVKFNLTDKGIDFLGYKTLRNLLGSLGKSSFGSHDTAYLATGIEADGWSKPYEFGDVLNIDVNETLKNSLARTGTLEVPMDLDYSDLMVRQAEYRSSLRHGADARLLAFDDPVRRGPLHAGEEGRARAHAPDSHAVPGDTLKVVLFHDSAEEIPLATLATAQVGPYHTNTAEGLKLARRLLMAQKKDMRQIIMITDGKPSALTMPNGQIYKNSFGLDTTVIAQTIREVASCRRAGIMINTFMLARDRTLVEFVKRVSEISRGKAYFTSTMTLGQFILMDFLKRKTKKGRASASRAGQPDDIRAAAREFAAAFRYRCCPRRRSPRPASQRAAAQFCQRGNAHRAGALHEIVRH